MNIGIMVSRSARRFRDRVAVWDDRREYSYLELDRRSNRVANYLLEGLGLKRGDRVAFYAHNRVEVAEMLLGCAKAGVVYIGLNFRLSESELSYIFGNSEPALVIVEGQSRALLEGANADNAAPLIDLDDEGPQGYESALATASDRNPVTLHDVWPDDDLCIVYSSGTTGTPKGILFDHGRLAFDLEANPLPFVLLDDQVDLGVGGAELAHHPPVEAERGEAGIPAERGGGEVHAICSARSQSPWARSRR